MFELGTYSVGEVHALLGRKYETKRIALSDGQLFKPSSQRLELFFAKGTICVECGIEGTIYVLETHDLNVPGHLNLYAETRGGRVMLTKDHILPRSKGGRDIQANYVPMCRPCNETKANRLPTDEELARVRELLPAFQDVSVVNQSGSSGEAQQISFKEWVRLS